MPATALSPPTTLITVSRTPTALVPPFHNGDWVGRMLPEESRQTTNRALLEPTLPRPPPRTRWTGEASVAAGLEGSYELAGAEETGAAKPGGICRAAGEITVQLAVGDHRARHGGFDISASAKLTGPMPQIAMTAGSFWPRITPS